MASVTYRRFRGGCRGGFSRNGREEASDGEQLDLELTRKEFVQLQLVDQTPEVLPCKAAYLAGR